MPAQQHKEDWRGRVTRIRLTRRLVGDLHAHRFALGVPHKDAANEPFGDVTDVTSRGEMIG